MGRPSPPGTSPTILMRILILSPVLPYPPTWGFVTRAYQFLRLLAGRHAVTLLAYADATDSQTVVSLRRAVGADVHTIPRVITKGTKRLRQLSSLVSPVSYQWRSQQSAQMQHKLTELTRQQQFDIIQIESSQLGCFKFDRRAALVVDEHNIEYELLYRTFLTERSPLRRAYNWIEFKKFKREEVSTWHRAAGIVTTSA